MQEQSSHRLGAPEKALSDDGTLHDLGLIHISLALTPTQRLQKVAAYVRMARSAVITVKASDRFPERESYGPTQELGGGLTQEVGGTEL